MIELVKTKSRNYDIRCDGQPLKLKVARSPLPYGFTVREYGGNPSKNIVISLAEQDDVDALHHIENDVIQQLSQHSESIFNREMTPEQIGEIFNSNISEGGQLRLKYTKDSRLFNADGQPMDKNIIDGIFSKWEVTCNYIVSGVYFMNKSVGLIIRANHIKLFEPDQQIGFMFLTDSGEDD